MIICVHCSSIVPLRARRSGPHSTKNSASTSSSDGQVLIISCYGSGYSDHGSWPAAPAPMDDGGGNDRVMEGLMTPPSSALTIFRANEEEIERRKTAVREKVFAQLGRAEQETKRLAQIRQELEIMPDPTRKDVAVVRRRIDAINRELKPLGECCLKKEKEYKEALEAFDQKNREKAQLVSKLVELTSESERLRMRRLEDLSNMIIYTRRP